MIVGNLISGSSAFSNPVCTSGISWFIQCWSLAWRILSIILLTYEMSAIVWWFEHSLALPFFGIGMKIDLFQVRNERLSYWGTSACYESDFCCCCCCFLLLLRLSFFWLSNENVSHCESFSVGFLRIHWTFGCVDPLLLSHLGSFQPLFIQVFFLTLSLISF